VTDLPRRSYPLVVPPPGGFEDAVRRGRRVRRRRTGGSTGAALVLAGVIAYASIGTPANTDGLRPTKQTPRQEETQAPYGESASPTPEPTAEPSPSATPDAPPSGTAAPAGPTQAPGTLAPADPDPTASARPTREQKPPRTRTYAKRQPIQELEPMPGGGDTGCIADGPKWCAIVGEYGSTIELPRVYEFSYKLCRSPSAGPGVVTFDRFQEVEFKARHVGTNDTVWTYSAGQPVGQPDEPTEIPAGYCVEWTTKWDGYDDFGHHPPGGTYEITAVSTGFSDAPLPSKTESFQHS
jgi:hypothetical protein